MIIIIIAVIKIIIAIVTDGVLRGTGYLQSQDVPMVVVSHDREFLDQLCNKLVETEQGVATTYRGNYTEYVKTKEEKIGQQWAAWEKQQKEIARQVSDVWLPGSALCMCVRAGAASRSLAEMRHCCKSGT